MVNEGQMKNTYCITTDEHVEDETWVREFINRQGPGARAAARVGRKAATHGRDGRGVPSTVEATELIVWAHVRARWMGKIAIEESDRIALKLVGLLARGCARQEHEDVVKLIMITWV